MNKTLKRFNLARLKFVVIFKDGPNFRTNYIAYL